MTNNKLVEISGIISPKIHLNVKHVFHLYVIRTKDRSSLQNYLIDNGIATGIHYPTPLPFLKAYDYLGYQPDDFPIAYKYKDEILSLPMFPELVKEDIHHIMQVFKLLNI